MITSACPRCDAPPESVETRGSSLRCAPCGLVFDPTRSPRARKPAQAKLALAAPEGFEGTISRAGLKSTYRDGTHGDADLLIVRRWSSTDRSRKAWVVLGLVAMISLPALGADLGAPLQALVIVGFIALVLLYVSVASWRNTTRITCKAGLFRLEHGPLPWPGNIGLEAASVLQLYCQAIETSDASLDRYRVMAIVRDQKRPTLLVDDLELASHALFLERAIERALGIEDRPVDGELSMKKLP